VADEKSQLTQNGWGWDFERYPIWVTTVSQKLRDPWEGIEDFACRRNHLAFVAGNSIRSANCATGG